MSTIPMQSPQTFTVGQKVARKAIADPFGRLSERVPNLTITHIYKAQINDMAAEYLVAKLPDAGQISGPVQYFEAQDDEL